jgi:5'-methylthioadenosine phosphorylase
VADLPRAHGDRLALVIGSSLGHNPFPVHERFTIEVPGVAGDPVEVVLDDIGSALVLLRHGAQGTVPAHRVDHHAHVRALCAAGCDRVLALGSAGGLRVDYGPGTVLAPDDFLAFSAYPTFHDDTAGYATPGFDLPWRAAVLAAWTAAGDEPVVDGGTYAQVRGPRFETPAEIRLLADYAHVVGMTLAAECVLAKEAGLRYAALCSVDNLANGLAPGEDPLHVYRETAGTGQPAFVARLGQVLAALSPG